MGWCIILFKKITKLQVIEEEILNAGLCLSDSQWEQCSLRLNKNTQTHPTSSLKLPSLEWMVQPAITLMLFPWWTPSVSTQQVCHYDSLHAPCTQSTWPHISSSAAVCLSVAHCLSRCNLRMSQFFCSHILSYSFLFFFLFFLFWW